MANKTIADFTQTTPADSDLILLSAGGTTMNATVKALREAIAVDFGSFSTLPRTINNAGITSNMVAFNWVLSNPRAQTSDWTVSTTNGSVTISGTISGTTSLTLYLGRF